MENRKGLMKISLAQNLRALMQREMFEKITIKQICDETGVIRATFYNYFDDKYDCLNWIVYHDLVEGNLDYIKAGNEYAVLDHDIATVQENKNFYKAGYQVTGQNAFEDMVRSNLAIAFSEYFKLYRKNSFLPQYNNDLLSRYYAECLAFDLREYVINRKETLDRKSIITMINDMMSHSFMDFLQESGKVTGGKK